MEERMRGDKMMFSTYKLFVLEGKNSFQHRKLCVKLLGLFNIIVHFEVMLPLHGQSKINYYQEL